MDIETKRMIFLSKNKRLILRCLVRCPKMLYELQKETNILLPNLSRAVAELEKNMLVYQSNPQFRKGKIFELTEKGKSCVEELIK